MFITTLSFQRFSTTQMLPVSSIKSIAYLIHSLPFWFNKRSHSNWFSIVIKIFFHEFSCRIIRMTSSLVNSQPYNFKLTMERCSLVSRFISSVVTSVRFVFTRNVKMIGYPEIIFNNVVIANSKRHEIISTQVSCWFARKKFLAFSIELLSMSRAFESVIALIKSYTKQQQLKKVTRSSCGKKLQMDCYSYTWCQMSNVVALETISPSLTTHHECSCHTELVHPRF